MELSRKCVWGGGSKQTHILMLWLSSSVSAPLTLTASDVCAACVRVWALLWSSDVVSAGSPPETSIGHFFHGNGRLGSYISLHPFFSLQHRWTSLKLVSTFWRFILYEWITPLPQTPPAPWHSPFHTTMRPERVLEVQLLQSVLPLDCGWSFCDPGNIISSLRVPDWLLWICVVTPRHSFPHFRTGNGMRPSRWTSEHPHGVHLPLFCLCCQGDGIYSEWGNGRRQSEAGHGASGLPFTHVTISYT